MNLLKDCSTLVETRNVSDIKEKPVIQWTNCGNQERS